MPQCHRIPLRFRRTPGNRFSLPVLLNALERGRLDRIYDIRVVDGFEALVEGCGPGPSVAAYSFMTAHLPEVRREIGALRRRTNAVLIAGGPHPSGDPHHALALGFDAVFQGDSERTLPEFCQIHAGNGGRIAERRIWKDTEPVPLDESFPFSGLDPFIPPLEIMRGCRNGCRFCQTRGKQPLFRSMESVERYLGSLKARGALLRLGFICPSGFEYGGGSEPDSLERLLAASKAAGVRFLEYGIFPSEVRPNTVNPGLLRTVGRYCSNRKITLGAQTGSEALLARVCRGHTVDEIDRAAALVREAGFRPQVDFILGFPGETEEDQRATLGLMRELARRHGAWNQVHYFLPLSGTPLYRSEPAPLAASTRRTLERFASGGVSNDWWKRGVEQSEAIVGALRETGVIPRPDP